MGMLTLHHHFRALTAMSPFQYQKPLRLVAARERMLAEGLDAASAAFAVGYESPGQFNPEYSRFFGQPPFIIPSDKTTPFLDPRFAATLPVVTAAQSGLGIGRGLVRTDKNNFAPRVGAALERGDKSVVRGGYGFYYPTTAAQGIRDPLATNAFNQAISKGSDPTTSTFIQPWP